MVNLPNASHWQQIQHLFEKALEIPADERMAFVKQSTDDQAVIDEVAQLLAVYDAGAAELEVAPYIDAGFQLIGGHPELTEIDSPEGYEIQGEISRGGQGVVYRALQVSTKRVVALKFLHTGPYVDETLRMRFEREVELAGRLRHPGIVRIFYSGLGGGQSFYVMDYIDGDHLDDFVSRKKLSTREILQLFIPIIEAVNYAHQRGVIHRDLKPSNILVDEEGRCHIVDFGLAKLGDSEDGETPQVSFAGQVMGTLNYMSPEQASGQPDSVGTRSDVYSLAVLLYRLLTGRLPYDLEGSLSQNLLTIQNSNPIPPKGISHELATIVLKALNKEPDRRYQTAGEFGTDLGRFLRGETIEARRDSILYLVRKTMQRHRVAAGVVAAFAVLIFTSAIVGWGLYLDAAKARRNESIASLNYQRERDTARKLRDESQIQRYFVEMDLAGRLLGESGGIGRIEEIASRWQREPDFPSELPGWEWYYLNSRLDRHVQELTLEEVPNCARFSPEGSRIAFGDDAGIVWICPTNEMAKLTQVGKHESVVRAVSWSSDGKLLASGSVDQKVFVYDTSSSEHIATFSHDDHVISVQWHPQYPVLASSSNDGLVKIWRVNERKLHAEFDIGTGAQSLDWTSDGNRLAVGTWAGIVRIWDLRTRELATDVTGYTSVLNAVRWSRSGKRIATGEDNGDLCVRNVASQAVIWELNTRRLIQDLTWSPDSRFIAVAGKDRSIKVWSASFPVLFREIEGHRDSVWSIDWSSDGQWLLTSSHDYTLKVWRAEDPDDDRVVRMPSTAPVSAIQWSPDDTRIAVGTERSEVLVFDVRTVTLRQQLDAGDDARLQTVSWSPDGRSIAAGGWGEKVVIWDVKADEKIVEFSHHNETSKDNIPNIVNCVAWSHDGKRVASSCYDSSIFIWDPESGDLIDSYTADRGNIYSVDWHPVKPDLIAASTSIHGAWIWSLGHPQPNRVDTERRQSRCIRWSPNGTRFAICRDDGLVTIHDSETTELQVSLKNHLGQVFSVDWHPTGKRLATASDDGTVRVWDATTGTQTISFERFGGSVACVAWSRDGQSLAVGGERGIVHIFDAKVGYERARGSR